MGVVLLIQARVDVETVPSAAQVTLVKYGALSYIRLKRKKEAALTQIATKIATVSFAEDSDNEIE